MNFRIICISASIAFASVVNAADYCLQFNGTSDYVALATTAGSGLTNNFTVEAWALTNAVTGTQRILSTRVPPTTPSGVGFGTRDSRWRLTTFGVKDYDTPLGVVQTGVWTHVAVSLDSSNTALIYVNGVLHTTVTHTAPGVANSVDFNVGRNPDATEYWNGMIDEVRLWDHVRTAGDISANYTHPLSGTETGLLVYLPFNEGSGTTTQDVSAGTADGTIFGATWELGPLNTAATDWQIYQ